MKQEVERGITITHKQETLEEAAERFSKKFLNNGQNSEFEAQAALLGVQFGARWQAERMYSEEELQQKIDAHLEVAKDLWLFTIKEQKKMYSEEDLVNLLEFNYKKETNQMGTLRKDYSKKLIKEWFEQFKKK